MVGILVGGGLFYVIFQLAPHYIGGGDVKLGAYLGLLLADWRLAFMMIALSAMLGSLIGLLGMFVHQTASWFKDQFAIRSVSDCRYLAGVLVRQQIFSAGIARIFYRSVLKC